MTQIVFSNPTVRVNNVTVGFKPNSLSFKMGKGEASVKGVSVGGGFSDIAVSENIEDRVGMVKFSLYSTEINIELLNVWKSIDIGIGNVVKIIDKNFTATMTSSVVVNDPDIGIGVDESFEVDFKGGVLVEFT